MKVYLILDQNGETTTILGTAQTIEQAREIGENYMQKMNYSKWHNYEIIEMEMGKLYMDDQELEYVK